MGAKVSQFLRLTSLSVIQFALEIGKFTQGMISTLSEYIFGFRIVVI